jgi:tripartite-type tricarboxylate transporter receptor subunit TctC
MSLFTKAGRLIALGAIFAAASGYGPACAQDAVADFYKGKQINLIVGTSPGGGYDLYGRLVSRYLGKYIPGNPKVIVSNMPGAASVVSLQYLYNVAPKDGTVIGAIYPSAIMEPLIGDRTKAKYDSARLKYIGSANSELYVCVVRTDTGVKTLDDFLAKDLVVGASAAGGSTRDFANLLKHVLGAKMRVVSGYPSSNEISLAVEKNEVQGVCGMGWSSVASARPQWIDGDVARIIGQEGLGSADALDRRGVATTLSRAKTEDQRRIMQLFYAPLKFGRPFVMAPEVPDARVNAIRVAFSRALKDPDLLAEANKMHIDVIETTGEDVQSLVADLYTTPAKIVAEARTIVGGGL